MPSIGDAIQVTVGNTVLLGRVKFATDTFVSVDQGAGVTAIIKYDSASAGWKLGKRTVQWQTAETFGERLQRVLQLAISKGYE